MCSSTTLVSSNHVSAASRSVPLVNSIIKEAVQFPFLCRMGNMLMATEALAMHEVSGPLCLALFASLSQSRSPHRQSL